MSDYDLETSLLNRQYRHICGIDEVGRGALFGPVVSGAVILDPNHLNFDIRDSKKLSPVKREYLAHEIYSHAIDYSIGWCWNDEIDEINILEATKKSMVMAVRGLKIPPDYVLMDGMEPDFIDIDGEGIIHGDDRCLSIAAASIIAKVLRDRLIISFDEYFPAYQLKNNKGYPTVNHKQAIETAGISPYHRKSFRVEHGSR